MTYKFIFSFLVMLSVSAVEFTLVNPCNGKKIVNLNIDGEGLTVGELSKKVLENRNIQFLASDYGISQIANSPTGIDAMEVLSDTRMRAHGWCYSIDSKIPELLMNEVYIDANTKNVTWFMGYSTYVGNPNTGDHEWFGQCEATHLLEETPFKEYCQI
jgi:hypothetical protein